MPQSLDELIVRLDALLEDLVRAADGHADDILDANSKVMFGPMRPGRPTRIMVTLPGEAADDPDLVAAFVDAGMDIARINVQYILDRLEAVGADKLGLLLKIETRQGFENLPAILLKAMQYPRLGVMIARGDLAVELGFERLSEVPRQILALCEAAMCLRSGRPRSWRTLPRPGSPRARRSPMPPPLSVPSA